MPVQVLHPDGDIMLDTSSGPAAGAAVTGPPGSTAVAAGGIVYHKVAGDWVPDSRSLRVTLNGNEATLSVGVDPEWPTCIRDAWLSYWED